MTQDETSVSVAICAYTEERWDDLVGAVRSVQDQTIPASETVVVIDHSDALLDRARTELPALAPEASIRVVPNSEQKGLSGARNSAVRCASGDVVAFLDDDARAAPDWIERLSDCYSDPHVVGVGGEVVPAWKHHRPVWFPREFDWVVGCTHRGVRSDRGPVRNFVGANMSFRRSELKRAGGFRSELGRVGKVPLGCEETELCIRVARDHSRESLVYEPGARVDHTVPAARGTWRYFRSRCYAEGLSKAAVSRLAGSGAALEVERSYVRRVLPQGMATSFGEAVRGRPASVLRAGAIAAGLTFTGVGYVVGRLRQGLDTSEVPKRQRWPAVASCALLAAALALWAVALGTNVALGHMTDLGLMTVLPVTFWAALGALTAAFAIGVTARPRARWLPAACVLALVAMLHATPTILYGTLRYSWAWKHVAVIDYILGHGRLDLSLSQLSAYQAWPGFFVLNAVFDKAGGVASSLSYAPWGPPVLEAAFLAPLLLIFRRFTDDERLVWTGVWFFYLCNWIGQDYFSPQALSYFLYLVVIAVCLRWVLPATRIAAADLALAPGQQLIGDPRRVNRAVLAFLALLIAAIATTHQLTPLMVVSAFGFLWVFRQGLPKRLLVLAVVVVVGWVLIAARSFLAGNLYWIIRSIGHPNSNATSTLVNLSKVTAGQALVANIDRLLSVGIWVLAAIGLWRRRGRRKSDRPFLLLALAPLPLIVSNSYGGEMLFRVYFFALPFVAIFAAASLFPSGSRGRSRAMPVAVFLVAAVLLSGFTFSYYGKEQVNYFNPDEVAAGQWVYTHAPAGSLLVSETSDWPYSYEHFERYQYEWFGLDTAQLRREVLQNPVGTLTHVMSPYLEPGAYVVFTNSQDAEVASLGLLPLGSGTRIENALLSSPNFRVVYSNASATVLQLTSGVLR